MGRSVTLATSRFCFDQNGDRSLSCGCIEILYCLYLVCITRRPFNTSQSNSCRYVSYYGYILLYSFVHAECGGDALMTGLALKPFLEVCMILYCCTLHTRRRARSTGSPMLHTGDAEKLFVYRICSFLLTKRTTIIIGKSNDTQT